MNRMPLALFSSRATAEPLHKRLVERGIKAELHDELRLEKLWFVSRPSAGVRVEVPAEQFPDAHRSMIDSESEGILRGAIRCPECKSLRVDYPQFTRKFLLPNLAMGLMSALGAVEKEYYCEDCHFTWPKEGTKPSTVRPHMAPYYFVEGVEQTTLESSKVEPAPRKAA